jgi:CHAD domain-containing protein
MSKQVFELSQAEKIQPLRDALEKAFSHLNEKRQNHQFSLYDTFDWRLFNKGRLFAKQKGRLVITDLNSGEMLYQWHTKAAAFPKFWWDFPDSHFKDQLKQLLGIRALVCLASLTHEQTHWNLLNEDEKIVARVVLEKVSVVDQNAMVLRCILEPVRGYCQEAKRAEKVLAASNLIETADNTFTHALVKAGLNPGGYSSKINVALTPEMDTRKAVLRLLSQLIGIMRINEAGIRNDIDSEFLHDFRVAVRRSRSLLGQVKHVFSPEIVADLQSDLRTLGKLTSRLRDLDVYLLMQSRYEALVPESLRPGVLQLFRSLKVKRRNEMKILTAAMAGTAYQAALENLEKFADKDRRADRLSLSGRRPIIETAKTVIAKRYRSIVKSGRKITLATPDQKIHDLRIDCKKLRYLLEFFASLFPNEEMKTLIKQLKILQDNLGTFNDLSVQQAFLYDHLKGLHATSQRATNMAASTGGLICRLYGQQSGVRDAFFVIFKQFDSKANRKRFANLFA